MRHLSRRERLEELSITLPPKPTPLAAYSPAVRAENFIYVSGQLPIHDGQMTTGIVPDVVSLDEATELSSLCFLNALAAALPLLNENESLQLVQLQGFVQSAPDFYDHPAIIDGASTLALQILGERGRHARIAMGVSALPKNAPVEISCTFLAVPQRSPRFLGRYRWFERKF